MIQADLKNKNLSPNKINRSGNFFNKVFYDKDNLDKIIPYSYIVTFKPGYPSEEIELHKKWVQSKQLSAVKNLIEISDFTNPFFLALNNDENVNDKTAGGIVTSFDIGESQNKLSGYSGYFLDEVVDALLQDSHIDIIERNMRVSTLEKVEQLGAPWGLARLSHINKLDVNTFNRYLYDDTAGQGVTSYVIDTGININHEEFEGRAVWGSTIPRNDFDEDNNGHGTHCAGTIASKTYGVAKKSNVVAVKVLRQNGTGSNSDVIKGVDFVVKSHLRESREGNPNFKGSTANMSLGGGKSLALNKVVNIAVRSGVHFAVAAGNENQNACNSSPASARNPITVSASTITDERAYFANYGECVDVFAAGLNVLSTYIGSNTETRVLSGTSMAAPHVCGLLSYFLSLYPDSTSEYGSEDVVSPFELKRKVLAFASRNLLTELPANTPNLLAYGGGGDDLSGFWDL
ncbi:S8 family peptidase [Ascoidea rubescens DSM 1968]|uniref:YEL060Cp-like protein n=1 Tax=Ascoidea rubescens DSM 1968 TaxID=1344418 RepID=A0A1D2VRV3_9ASCO|nr:YEL060Cp-like protein [Ascoidea rubescens DSM 1968]ODV64307.1 YEL060Cp-like protein [Ascoidea rubescens DSM 1968]